MLTFTINMVGFLHQKEQARKAHSSAFCIDLHLQTLMTMMGNDDNDGQWRQWCHWRFRCFTHLPFLATLSWRQCLHTGTLPIPLRNLPQSQCFALALYCNEEVKNIYTFLKNIWIIFYKKIWIIFDQKYLQNFWPKTFW